MSRHESPFGRGVLTKGIVACLMLMHLVVLSSATESESLRSAEVFFSPTGGATEAVVEVVNSAKFHISLQAYTFTSRAIAKALVDARKRGVDVEVILDKGASAAKYSTADFLSHSGIRTYIDSAHAIAHNKVIIIDRNVIVTGSFNFTRAAEERNAENLLVIKNDKSLVAKYEENFRIHLGHSLLYRDK